MTLLYEFLTLFGALSTAIIIVSIFIAAISKGDDRELRAQLGIERSELTLEEQRKLKLSRKDKKVIMHYLRPLIRKTEYISTNMICNSDTSYTIIVTLFLKDESIVGLNYNSSEPMMRQLQHDTKYTPKEIGL